jgi:hypothetical protein
MDPEIARNQNYDAHYANDSKDVLLLCSHSMMMARGVLARHVSAAIELIGIPSSVARFDGG